MKTTVTLIKRIMLPLMSTLILSVFVFGGCKKPSGQIKEKDKKIEWEQEGCGHCLKQKGGEPFCTEEGTKVNFCYAVCKGLRVLCRQECPCPGG